jgi:hypothetical protein
VVLELVLDGKGLAADDELRLVRVEVEGKHLDCLEGYNT